jgi:hypothetical protein
MIRARPLARIVHAQRKIMRKANKSLCHNDSEGEAMFAVPLNADLARVCVFEVQDGFAPDADFRLGTKPGRKRATFDGDDCRRCQRGGRNNSIRVYCRKSPT